MHKLHTERLKLVLISLVPLLSGLGIGLAMVGPAGLPALIRSINIPIHILAGIITMSILSCGITLMGYRYFRLKGVGEGNEVPAAMAKFIFFFIMPLVIILGLLNHGLIDVPRYLIGIGGLSLFFFTGEFLYAVLGEFLIGGERE